jgi:hypothetical protein
LEPAVLVKFKRELAGIVAAQFTGLKIQRHPSTMPITAYINI